MPCAASPPSAFLPGEGGPRRFWRKSIRWARSRTWRLQKSARCDRARSSRRWHGTPEVVPFREQHIAAEINLTEIGQPAVLGSEHAHIRELQLLPCRHPLRRSSPTSRHRCRAHPACPRAISKHRYRRPARWRTNSPAVGYSALVLSMASFRRALPSLARCERPRRRFPDFLGTSRALGAGAGGEVRIDWPLPVCGPSSSAYPSRQMPLGGEG